MKRVAVFCGLALLSLASAGCIETSQQKLAKMQSSIDSLTAESERKSQAINEFFASINAIEENLAQVRNMERTIGDNVKNYAGDEIPTDAREQINDDIMAINDIMAQNREKIAQLSAALKKSNIQTAELQRIISSTEQKINERDETITQLKTQLERLNFSVDTLNMVVDTLTKSNLHMAEVIASKEAKLNEAWYAVGKRAELIDNKVIENRWLKKNYRLLRDFNPDYFTQLDISKTDTIPLYSRGSSVVVVTNHPQDSYTLQSDDEGNVKLLRITDKERFWSASRYLVVVIK